jgi:transcription elongation factor
MADKNDWNKRIKPHNTVKKVKNKNAFLIKNFTVEEVLDESGEVLEDTVIKFSFDGILVYLSISNSLKFNKLLNDILSLKDKYKHKL